MQEREDRERRKKGGKTKELGRRKKTKWERWGKREKAETI